jgi:hypothetical protein
MFAPSSKIWRLGRKQYRAPIIALLCLLLAFNVALAYTLLHVTPFAGSIFNTGEISITTAYTNDDGTENEPMAGFDVGDSGPDPIAAADLTDPYTPVARAASNIQSCVATVTDEVMHLNMSNTYDALTCAVKFRVVNESGRPMVYDGAAVNGAPIEINQDPAVGTCIPVGNQPFMHIEFTPAEDAVSGETWTEASADVTFSFHDVATCP